MNMDGVTTPPTDGTGTTGPQDIGYLLTAYADGELNDEGRRWVEAQLLASPALRERYDQIRALQDALRRHLPECPGPDALETERANHILSRLRRDGSRTRKRGAIIRYRPLIISFLAASIMAAVVLGAMSLVVYSAQEKEEELPPMKLTLLDAPMAASTAAPAPAPAEDGTMSFQVAPAKPGYAGTPKDLRSRDLDRAAGAVVQNGTTRSVTFYDGPGPYPSRAPAREAKENRGESEVLARRQSAVGAAQSTTEALAATLTETDKGDAAPITAITIATGDDAVTAPIGREEAQATKETGDTAISQRFGGRKSPAAQPPPPPSVAKAESSLKDLKKATEKIKADDNLAYQAGRSLSDEERKPAGSMRAAMIWDPTKDKQAPANGQAYMAIGAGAGPGADIYRDWLVREFPPLAPDAFAARLGDRLTGFSTWRMLPDIAALRGVVRQGAVPLEADDETRRLVLSRRRSLDHVIMDSPQTTAQGLLQVARRMDLQVVPGEGVLQLQVPRLPLDPTTTGSLAPEAFRTAFGTEPMRAVKDRPQITTALDGDASSFTRAVAQVERNQPIDPATVRPEHFINAMPTDYPAAQGPEAFTLYAEAAPSPFPVAYPIARGRTPLVVAVGVVGRAADTDERKPLRLTLAVDASGSMAQTGGIERVRRGLRQLVGRLTAADRIAVVAFADAARVVLPATPGDQGNRILAALDALTPAGSTNAIDGLMLAYQLAAEQATSGVETRVVLASDGAALAGGRAQEAIARAQQWRGRGISLLVLGCGDERRDADALQSIADRCDGQHVALASDAETDKAFATTLLPARLGILARDAKLQVTWNPERVAWARLIGYDQRRIADKDFRNDAVDAGELNHETRLTALFEIIPADGAAGPLGEAAVRYFDTRLERVRELACPMPGSVLATRANDRLRLLACAAETAEWLQRGWWSNVRLPDPRRIRDVLTTCPQPEARTLERMIGPVVTP